MSTWYLGPAGDLRALECPEPNIQVSDVRYGGVHQGLGGGRVIDVTGIKSEYVFEWDFLTAEEYRWLKALHTRHIPGPHRLINPMIRNRLTVAASSCDAASARYPGVEITSGAWSWSRDWPSGVDGPGVRSLSHTGRASGAVLRFDRKKRVTLFPGETVTGSAYIKGASAFDASITIDWYDVDGVFMSATNQSISLTTSWARYSVTGTAPEGAVTAVLAVWSMDTASYKIAAPQFESGTTATEWEQGGGAPLVVIDQLTTTTPRFPYLDCSLTLMEA
jgi:hypothetical protein